MGVPPDVDRHVGADLLRQAVVVQMWMGEEHAQEAVVDVSETGHAGKKAQVISVGRVQGQAQIEDDASSIGLHFNAGAADFFCPPMDANFHPFVFPLYRDYRRPRRPNSGESTALSLFDIDNTLQISGEWMYINRRTNYDHAILGGTGCQN